MLLLLGARHRGIRLLLHCILGHRLESRNNDRGYYPLIVLYDLLSNRQLLALRRTSPPLDLHPLEVPPTDLKEIRWPIGSSGHIAQLSKENRGTGHAVANVMKQEVLMDPRVAQLEPASLQCGDQPLRVQQDRVERDPSLVIRWSARRAVRLLLHLGSCQTCGESNSVDHSLHDPES